MTRQAGDPESVLSLFLDARLPQRDLVAQVWAREAEAAPWSGMETDPDHRMQLGNAIEIRIGLDVAAVPGYWDALSFLPPEECRALLSAAGYSADGRDDLADTGTTDPLLLDWRRVSHPLGHGDDERAVLSGCWDAAGMRDVAHGIDVAVQLRRSLLARIRQGTHRTGPLQGPVMTALTHMWDGYLHHGRRRMLALGDRVIIEPELAFGFGKGDLVIGRCLVDVKAALSPAASFGRWLDQLLCYVLLDWANIFTLDSVALYLGWQGLLVHEPLTGLLAASAPGSTPTMADLRAEFWSRIRAEADESLTSRLRHRYRQLQVRRRYPPSDMLTERRPQRTVKPGEFSLWEYSSLGHPRVKCIADPKSPGQHNFAIVPHW